MKKIMLIIIAVALIAGGYVLLVKPKSTSHTQAKEDLYYCPMHPNYTSPKPGICPICNMNLVKRKEQDQKKTGNQEAGVQLSDYQQQLIGIKTIKAAKKPLVKTVNAVGVVSTSLELYQKQNEFIDAYVNYVTTFRDYKRVKDRRRSWETHRQLQTQMLEARNRLLVLGLSEYHVMKLQNVSYTTVWQQPELQMFTDNHNYWVIAKFFESDLGFIEVGQEASVYVPAYYETIKGVIRSVGGIVDEKDRTVNALIELKDYRGELHENMLVQVKVASELNAQLLLPRGAVIDSGLKQMVFVKKTDGQFEARSVSLGWSADDWVAIKSGISEGEDIVSQGHFLLDGESRLQTAFQGAQHVH